MNEAVERLFDASAVLTILFDENGADRALQMLPGCISAVNAAEVLAKLVQKGMPVEAALAAFEGLDLEVLPFGAREAEATANFVHPKLSLGDRACLATASLRHAAAVTAERLWRETGFEIQLVMIR